MMMLKMFMPSMPKMPESEKKEESAESVEEKKEQERLKAAEAKRIEKERLEKYQKLKAEAKENRAKYREKYKIDASPDPSDEDIVKPKEVRGPCGSAGGDEPPDGGDCEHVGQATTKGWEMISLVSSYSLNKKTFTDTL